MTKKEKILVIGAGLAGAVHARELAEAGFDVTVIDKRNHIGGNCYDFINEYGIRVHQYGPHIFHTSNEKVVDWLTQYTEWVDYKHRVKAKISPSNFHTMPINKNSLSSHSKEEIINIFFRPYTKKMWGLELEEISKNILDRVPIREDENEFYFPKDSFQAMPKHGYTAMFENILQHPHIHIKLGEVFNKTMEADFVHIFNSMAIDEYYDYCYGELPYRSIRFEVITLPENQMYETATTNFTTHTGPTRVTEWKNFPNGGQSDKTTLTYEYPCDYKDNHLERYYPVQDIHGKNKEIYLKYKAIQHDKMTFIGRCGTYQYLDMHQVVSSALASAHTFIQSQGGIS